MEERELHEILLRYNRIYKDMDQLYHMVARHFDLSDCALWILYLLRETEREYTQAGICEALSFPRQTVHSALKGLQEDGRIVLERCEGNRKTKLLRLTPEGVQFVRGTIDRVLEAERRTLERFAPEEREAFLALNEAYARGLRSEMERTIGVPLTGAGAGSSQDGDFAGGEANTPGAPGQNGERA